MNASSDLPPWAQASGAGVARVAARLYEMVIAEMDRRSERTDSRLTAIEAVLAPQLSQSREVTWERISREANMGEWRPWEWADDLGVSELEFHRMAARRLNR